MRGGGREKMGRGGNIYCTTGLIQTSFYMWLNVYTEPTLTLLSV